MSILSNIPDLNSTLDFLNKIQFYSFLKAILILFAGYWLARYASLGTRKVVQNHLNAHQNLLLERSIFYAILAIFTLMALQHLGFSLSILLGATGVVSLAFGFASQTSAANLISGLFLVLERSFQIGDSIALDQLTGEVYSIDPLSVKLKTAENTFVRIPNETLIKSTLINLSRFEFRRLDILISISYTEQLQEVTKELLCLANEHSLCLKTPAPFVNFENFGEYAIQLRFAVFTKQEYFQILKNELATALQERFSEKVIDIPFSSRTVMIKANSKES